VTWICLAHISGHGADSGYVVALALVAGVILVFLGLGSLHRRERVAMKGRR
jgi:hypothetical protein